MSQCAFAVFLRACPIYVQSETHAGLTTSFSNSMIVPTSLDLSRLFPQTPGQQDEVSLRILVTHAANIQLVQYDYGHPKDKTAIEKIKKKYQRAPPPKYTHFRPQGPFFLISLARKMEFLSLLPAHTVTV